MKKLELYNEVKEEAGVIMIFTKMHESLGFPKLVVSSARGFDIDNIEYKGKSVTVEFEYDSKNFISHGHVEKMVDDKKYVVVCWNDDCNLSRVVKNNFNKEIYEVIELRDYVEVRTNIETNISGEIGYIILNYNPRNADYRAFSEWKNSNLYRGPKFSKSKSYVGSKVLIKQGDYIVGGFDIVRYEIIKKPTTEYEWNLYKSLTDYPVSMFTDSIENMNINFSEGHIFYDNFFSIEKARLSIKEILPDIKMGYQGIVYITAEQYYKLVK